MDRFGRSANSSLSLHDVPANSHPTPGSSTSGRKNKLANVMKRSFPPLSPRPTKNHDARDRSYTYFHYEERAGHIPTVEQISMGLHLSRTPHLRSTSGRSRSISSEVPAKPDAKLPSRSRATIPFLKPALKNIPPFQTTPTSATPSFTNVSTSTSTTLASAKPRTGRQTSFAPRLFSRMTKIIPSSQTRLSRGVVLGTEPDPEVPSPKKLVRFSVDETE